MMTINSELNLIAAEAEAARVNEEIESFLDRVAFDNYMSDPRFFGPDADDSLYGWDFE